MKNNEAQALIVEICQKVILSLSQTHKVQTDHLNLRIDMQDIHSKPVFAVFEKSRLITPCTLKEVIHAGGGQGLAMIVGMYVQNIIRDIFSASLKQLNIEQTKHMFVLLSISDVDGENVPMISVYKNGKFLESAPVADFIEVAK